MTRSTGLSLVCIAALSVSAWAVQPGTQATGPDAIRQREQQRVTYLTAADYDGLARMTSPTLSYSHSNGSIQTRDQWLGDLRAGTVKFASLQHREVAVRFPAPTVAILNGLSDVEVSVSGQVLKMTLRITIVYVEKDGHWLFEAWHSSRRVD